MTDILKSFSVLQSELDVARSTLKGVDENIKRLIGRDPSDLPIRPLIKRNVSNLTEDRGRPRGLVNQNDERNSRLRMFVQDNEVLPTKKRTTGISVFKRLSDRPIPSDSQSKQHKGMISKVIVTPKEIPSRQERMDAQSRDVISVARNRRMFGALLGTLQKFQQEETKLKKKEDKRAQLEKKIEEHEIKEKEEVKKERQQLFFNRKKKQAEIKMIELKMLRMKDYAVWEESQKQRMNFIYTKTKPEIHFLPRKLNESHKVILEKSRSEIQNLIDKKREQVQEELLLIEERGKRMYEPRKINQRNQDEGNDEHDRENGTEDEDVTMEDLSQQENNSLMENRMESIETEIGENDSIQIGEKALKDKDFQSISHSQSIDLPTETVSDIMCANSSNYSEEQQHKVEEFSHSNYVSSSSIDYVQQAEAAGNNINKNQNGHCENNIIVPNAENSPN